MRKLLTTLAASAVVLGGIGITASSASAEPYYHHHWGYGGYHHGYRHDGAAWGAGLAGLATGAVVGGLIADSHPYGAIPVERVSVGESHAAYCEAHHRYYDPRTNTFIGRDGRAYVCR